jgi:UDP-N-acetylmuramoylalanine--D-glutamate ligase
MKIALVGYGIEGKSAYTYFVGKYPDAEFVVYDESESPKVELPEGVALISGPTALQGEIDAEIVVRTPSVPPSHISTRGRVTSVTEEFLQNCPAPIVGVTGTKGKGTTSSLIDSILKADGRKSWLVGNIGTAALDILPEVKADHVVVYEMSSFQLWDVTKSPHVAVVLMMEQDHLDVHKDMEDYVNAKANIRRFQQDDDVCFYYPENKYSLRIAFAEGARGKAIRYGTPDESGVYVKSNTFFIHDDPICDTNKLQLPGDHNLGNACAAISAAKVFDVSNEAVAQGLEAFTGLPHRLKFVREVNGVRFYDDSIATTPGSAIAALKSFEGKKVIILGGSEKGSEYESIVEECKVHDAKVVAIGTTGSIIAKLCNDRGVSVVELGKTDMDTIVRTASEEANGEGVVILSPASASFDMFKNYADRGDQFVASVEAL